MATEKFQTVAENNIVAVALANVQPSNYNPRKYFDETSLAELAESIRQQGVIQPIGVRPVADTDRFEIVFGERRYRASLMAGLEEIPAVVLNVSDETAEEMAITENLQRQDVTPMEEANAYQKLMESGRYDVQSLAVQFGKSESYIRTRLKFASLIPEIALLLEQDELTVSVAAEICRYGEDIQREVYIKHLKEESMLYSSWRGLKAAEVAKYIERDYTTDLERYAFDKTLCLSCPHNTNNMTLFCEGGCGKCANRSCLAEMNASYLVEKALQFVEQYPSVSLGYQDFNNNMVVVERLKAMGYEVEHLNTYATAYPEVPVAPEKEEYDTIEEYEQAHEEYEQDFSKYMEKCRSIHERIDTGELTFYICIGQKEIKLCYKASAADTDEATEKPLSPVEKLEKQDKRNKEIALEKTVEDTKKQILDVDMSESKFTQDEEKMIYFFLLSSLRKEHFGIFGIGEKETYQHLTDEEKMDIIANLTAKQKAVIRRDFLIANFKGANGSNATATHQYPLDYIQFTPGTYSYWSSDDRYYWSNYEYYRADQNDLGYTNYFTSVSWVANTWKPRAGRGSNPFCPRFFDAEKKEIYYYWYNYNENPSDREHLYTEYSTVMDHRMYHIQITSTSEDYVLARPLTDADGQPVKGEDNAERVSPSFMINSQLGAVNNTVTSEEAARQYAAQYAEVYTDEKTGETYVYDDWRLPTPAEIKIAKKFQGLPDEPSEAMYEVMSGLGYWTSNGHEEFSEFPGSGSQCLRLVRDVFSPEDLKGKKVSDIFENAGYTKRNP